MFTRAVGITARGGPEVLRVIEREVRNPGPGEVRIAVELLNLEVDVIFFDTTSTSRPSRRVASSFDAGSRQRWQTTAKIARSPPERPRPFPSCKFPHSGVGRSAFPGDNIGNGSGNQAEG